MFKKILISIFTIMFFNYQLATAKCPDYCQVYIGNDKLENFNRKMFNFNLKLNKYAIRPVHILWSSIMPEFAINRIQDAYKNIEYPKRVVSCLIQKDFKASKTETIRFLANTTIGLGGLFDVGEKLFKIKSVDEDMEQALSKCHVNSGAFIVVPVLTPTNPRGLVGKAFDLALNPTSYIATPVLAMVKAGLTINRTTPYQALAHLLESNYADPYDIAKKLYGIQTYIKCENFDRKEVLETEIKKLEESNPPENELVEDSQNLKAENIGSEKILTASELYKNSKNIDEILTNDYKVSESKLLADKVLFDYNPQCPIVDSMRTAMFKIPDDKKSIWNELSLWNKCFRNRLKTSSVNFVPERENYYFKYILQKDKTAPVAIIYPSIGEGVNSSHSVYFAKMFYDAGYSVIIQGSHFQWEFVKSMPKDYRPGIPDNDADYLKSLTLKILAKLETQYGIKPKEKLIFGTSFGALATLFLGEKEFHNNTLGDARFIAVCPPVELSYAMTQVDKNSANWNEDDFKNRTSITAAKVLQLLNTENYDEISQLPFNEEEGKLITGFIMHQKLSDLIFSLEDTCKCKKCCDFYKDVNNITYKDYVAKYLLNDNFNSIQDFEYQTSLHKISDYLTHADNYKIYHSITDYLTTQKQLKQLKLYTGKKTVLFDNGAHLGFLYRKEFIDELKADAMNKLKSY